MTAPESSSWLTGLLDVNPDMLIVTPRDVEFPITDMVNNGFTVDDLTDYLASLETL